MQGQEHPVFKFLEYGANHRQFTIEEACEGIGIPISQASVILPMAKCIVSGQTNIYVLRHHHIIDYLDYIKLQEARESSRKSMRVAIAAIIISSIIGVSSILTSFLGSASVNVLTLSW